MVSRDEIEEAVRHHYAKAARGVIAAPVAPTDDGCDSQGGIGGIGASCYQPSELEEIPSPAVVASIGCADPVAVAELRAGEVVLDLGSGGGLDVLLSARRVGPTGKVYGLDPTDEMLDLARSNQGRAGVDNVEFLKGRMESIPLPEASVDVVLSNCVIALSVDKAAAFSEAHRVLRPGGRFAVADVVTHRPLGPPQQADVATWVDCASGALTEAEYRTALATAGFVDVSISHSHAVEHDLTSVIVRASKSRASRRPVSP